ncbi:hypothetical protein RHMOL_Rhmol06G0269100 [Rhododendron molle]|uniref:Uncharacterized protein n=1 Tax=Rhododendron molle TaxID=49168 RepID=A0ACC0NI90_RHOML|nr:hypothetical protein RHMOL_Rhmol06G0269100 [Rhododendron molle]
MTWGYQGHIPEGVMSCFSNCFRKAASPPKHTIDIDEEVSGIQNVKLYTYRELSIATGGFSPANKVGQGGFGSVYKGRLRDGTMVAIKLLSAESRQGVREFMTEIIVISDIEHENLVKLDLTPKISDFGLAKLFPEHVTHISTRIAGTLGYLAPEYAIRGQLTRKADIYSFGVLLLEIVSGRCNNNTRLPIEEQYLLEWAWELYERGELPQLVDKTLEGDYDVDEACKFFRIGLLCTQDMAKIRPSMSEVVKMLTGEMHVDDEKISKPGLISELMGLKRKKDSSDLITGDSNKIGDSSSGSRDATCATMTFTAISARSD